MEYAKSMPAHDKICKIPCSVAISNCVLGSNSSGQKDPSSKMLTVLFCLCCFPSDYLFL